MNQELICASVTCVTSGQLLTPTQALLRGFTLFETEAAPTEDNAVGAPQLVIGTTINGVQARQGFRVGPLNLMIGYADSSELTEMPDIYRIPNAPVWFCGMANLHGMLTPVFDLSRYLEVERDAASKKMLLVLSHGADAAGVVIDGIPERLRWSADDQVDIAAAPARLAPHLRAACIVGEGLYFDLECNALLNALEQALESAH